MSWLPLPRAEAYGASKAALDYLADTLRLDLAGKGIGVTLIRPGFVQTPLTAKNDFPMPCLVTVEEASRAIMAGLVAGRHQIHFPAVSSGCCACLARCRWGSGCVLAAHSFRKDALHEERIAIVGSGISGLTAGFLLHRLHDITLFEAAPTLGPHRHRRRPPGGAQLCHRHRLHRFQ